MMVSAKQFERLGILARQKPFGLMNGTTPRIVGPVDAKHDALTWVVSVGRNKHEGIVSVEIEHSIDGETWQGNDPPIQYTTKKEGETAYIAMTRAEDVPAETQSLRAVIRGGFSEAWHYAGMEVVCRTS